MLDRIAGVNLDYLVDLAGHPGWAAERVRTLEAETRKAGARYGDGAIPTFPKPLFIAPDQERRIRRAAEGIVAAFNAFVDVWLEDPDLQQAWNLSDEELELYRVDPGFPDPIRVARIDGFLHDHRIRFLEANCDSPGGPGYGDVVDETFRAGLLDDPDLVGGRRLRSVAHRPALVEALLDTYRTWRGERDDDRPSDPRIVVTDWADVRTRPDIDLVVEALRQRGHDASFADPRDLELDGDRLVQDGDPVDLVYKRVIVSELLDASDADALVEAYKLGTVCVVNPPRSLVVGNKVVLAAIQRPEVLERLAPEHREVVARCLPWTAILRDATIDVEGRRVDLRDFVLDHRAELVLKAGRSYGGKEVVLGSEVDDERWGALVDEHLDDARWIVQERLEIPRELFPVVEDGRVDIRPMHVNVNPFVFGGSYAGCYTRVSGDPVINISHGGGLVPTMVVDDMEGGS